MMGQKGDERKVSRRLVDLDDGSRKRLRIKLSSRRTSS